MFKTILTIRLCETWIGKTICIFLHKSTIIHLEPSEAKLEYVAESYPCGNP